MLVADELARGHRGRCEAGAEHQVVEAALEQLEQLVAGRTTVALGLAEQALDLLLAQTIVEAQLLLLDQLHAEAGLALRTLAVLAGRIIALTQRFARQPGSSVPKARITFRRGPV